MRDHVVHIDGPSRELGSAAAVDLTRRALQVTQRELLGDACTQSLDELAVLEAAGTINVERLEHLIGVDLLDREAEGTYRLEELILVDRA